MSFKRWKHESLNSKIFDVIIITIMCLLLVVFLYPILNVIAISFSDYSSIARGLVTIYPQGFTIASYEFVFKDQFLYFGYLNTILYALVHTIIMLIVTSLVAYPLTKRDFVAKTPVTVMLMITMFFSGGMIPTYLLMRDLHLINTFWVMVIPGALSAYNCMVFRTFFKNIPYELSEAAYIEGAGEFRILTMVIIPLSKALLATFALFSIIGVWNSWFNAMLYLNDQRKYPLQMILRNYLFLIDNNQIQQRAGMAASVNPLMQRQIDPKGVRMAMIVITMFPIMAIYPFFQKYFVKGVMIGAVKG